jgi:hypothetical protein
MSYVKGGGRRDEGEMSSERRGGKKEGYNDFLTKI